MYARHIDILRNFILRVPPSTAIMTYTSTPLQMWTFFADGALAVTCEPMTAALHANDGDVISNRKYTAGTSKRPSII